MWFVGLLEFIKSMKQRFMGLIIISCLLATTDLLNSPIYYNRGLSKQNPRHAVDALKNMARPLVQAAAEVVPELEPRELCLTLLKAQIQTMTEDKVR